MSLKATVIGAGSWGTALAHHLAGAGHRVTMWAYEEEVARDINQNHRNQVFLADIPLNAAVTATNDLSDALAGAQLVLLVMPSHVYRRVLSQAADLLEPKAFVVSCAKGIEENTGYTMGEVFEEVVHRAYHRRFSCLSGPSFAREVAVGQPTAVTIASRDLETAARMQEAFATNRMRVYTSPDLTGVEMGGAIKNPLAIAAGMCEGLGLGKNTLAALITRGLAEMTRLVIARGGQLETMAGLAGLGDLVLTANSSLSRNYTVGKRLGTGESIAQIQASMRMVAEGVINTKTVLSLAARVKVEMPITEAVYQVIYEARKPLAVLDELMTRDLKPEAD